MPLSLEDPKRLAKDFVIFYCWQDHSDKKLNRYLIRDAIKGAIQRVKLEIPPSMECVLRFDCDTSGRSGSAEIANTILSKINASSIVIGDVTPVFRNKTKDRFYPNPNVMLELGFAARSIGWNRVISVYNDRKGADGIRPKDLPFDIQHRRLTRYSCVNLESRQQSKKDLEDTLVLAIKEVIIAIARGEVDPTLGHEVVKRARDVDLLRQVLSTIHRNTMNNIVDLGTSSQLYYDGLPFFDGFEAKINSCQFRFYDSRLKELLLRLHKEWATAVNLGQHLFYPGNSFKSFHLLPAHQREKGYNKRLAAMRKAYAAMPAALRDLLDYIHHSYPEIDMTETDRSAWDAYVPNTNSIQSLAAKKAKRKKKSKSSSGNR